MIREWKPGDVVKRNALYSPDSKGQRYAVVTWPGQGITLLRLTDFQLCLIDQHGDKILFDKTGLSLLSD